MHIRNPNPGQLKVLAVVGTRPNIIKHMVVQRAFASRHPEVELKLVHTGQHSEPNMSGIFFQEFKLPPPDYQFLVSNPSPIRHIGEIMWQMERVLAIEKPDTTIVYGDVNSTPAAAWASARKGIPITYIEGGIRNPDGLQNHEEINRRLTSSISHLVFPPTEETRLNLLKENFPPERVFLYGDTVCDALHYALGELQITATEGDYVFAAFHRHEDMGAPGQLRGILEALIESGKRIKFLMHPSTEKKLKGEGLYQMLEENCNFELIPPQGFFDFVRILAGAGKVLTDGGGTRRQAYMLGKPTIILDGSIYLPEIVKTGWGIVTGTAKEKILAAIKTFDPRKKPRPALFGDGHAAEKIVDKIVEIYNLRRNP
ncbi:UDP-N-acetylglucosamine 2-epimerase [Candidatus Anstonella stagnisolia]|nr:UDP-N-acetylglucosamine 2-epimerase [Candidatus Anstonella stagnisolia]